MSKSSFALTGIEALMALEKFGTVSEAAVRLRLTQSAVSKRLRALERSVAFALLEREGRRVRLTLRAVELLDGARPLMAALRDLVSRAPSAEPSAKKVNFSLALADSIASSWGPRVVSRALSALPRIEIDLHAHRSVLIVENVRLGRYQLGLTADVPTAKDLVHHPIAAEPMVLLRAGTKKKQSERPALISIEPTSATWRAIEPLIAARQPQLLERRMIPVESFSAALQMVKAGFGDGLIPLGLAREARLSRRSYRVVPGIERHISLLMRKTTHQLPEVGAFSEQLKLAAAEIMQAAGR